MKTLYLDCGMGAAGDMLTAALLELLPEPEAFVKELNEVGIPGVEYRTEPMFKCGILGTHMTVLVHGTEEDEHLHDHPSAATPAGIEKIVEQLKLPTIVREDILSVYGLIAQAESHAHGLPVTQIHFHEVGTLDAVADIAAVCLLIRRLAPERILASEVHVGSGSVHCAHGILPVPAPATAYILRGVPICASEIPGELCTPTGAALLRHFVTEFGPMPSMTVERIGYGMGKKDFPKANCIRAMLGKTRQEAPDVCRLSCNVDDMTGEEMGFALEELLTQGALEAYTVPVGMKKSRPGLELNVLCKPDDRERMVELIFLHTTTIGIREERCRRYTMDRTITVCDTPLGKVRRKESSGYGVTRRKYEYEDLAALAREKGMSLAQIREILERT